MLACPVGSTDAEAAGAKRCP